MALKAKVISDEEKVLWVSEQTFSFSSEKLFPLDKVFLIPRTRHKGN